MNLARDGQSRRQFLSWLGALVLACSFALAQPAFAARIVVFGDSWGVPAAPALQTVLIDNGLPDTVFNAAAGGETAANLSSPSGLQQISASLTANLDADLVHLSISGNDFLGSWNSSFTPMQQDALFQTIITDVETIVDHIIAERPGVQILWSSYDFPRPLPLGTPTEVNAAGIALARSGRHVGRQQGAESHLHRFLWTHAGHVRLRRHAADRLRSPIRDPTRRSFAAGSDPAESRRVVQRRDPSDHRRLRDPRRGAFRPVLFRDPCCSRRPGIESVDARCIGSAARPRDDKMGPRAWDPASGPQRLTREMLRRRSSAGCGTAIGM